MKRLALFLGLILCGTTWAGGTTWAEGENLLNNPAVKFTTAGAATVVRMQNGDVEVTYQAGAGWPQINVTGMPPPQATNTMCLWLDVFLSTNSGPQNININGFPTGSLVDVYFNNKLKEGAVVSVPFPFSSTNFNAFRISAKNPATTFQLVFKGIYYARNKNLAEGYGFESPSDMGQAQWAANNSARFRLSTEHASLGSQSLKLELDIPDTIITYTPDIKDWTPYKQLRFTLFNPLQVQKYRVLLVNSTYLLANCSIASGFLTVPPESEKEFILDLDTLPASIGLTNITAVQFYKGDTNTVFYLDSMKLYTAREVELLGIQPTVIMIK